MIKVIKILPQGFASNSYILTVDGARAVVIDCAQPRVYDKCIGAGLKPEAVLLTHGHYDHVGGCYKFTENGVPVYCGESEKSLVFSREYGFLGGGTHVEPFAISDTFTDGQECEFAGIKFKIIATPGHSLGGICYLTEDNLFTGDTLFHESVGRCDLPGGNANELVRSIKRLYSLTGDYKVYCGHEDDTTLDHERKYNPYVRQN